MERLVGPALRKRPQDVPVRDDQHVAVGVLSLSPGHHRCVPLVPDVFDQPVETGRDVGWVSVRVGVVRHAHSVPPGDGQRYNR